jgi:hypothetical protein
MVPFGGTTADVDHVLHGNGTLEGHFFRPVAALDTPLSLALAIS